MKPTPFPSAGFSFLAKANEITGWHDGILAELTGVPRSTVQAYRTGRCIEYLGTPQIRALLNAVRLYRDQISQGVEEMEMMS